jgi:SAM-dependent methyltransferase
MRVPEREYADVETSSDAYARRFSGAVGEWFLERQAACTGDLLRDLPPGASVLDVGGGHAQLVPLLVSQRFAVTVAGSSAACAHRLSGWVERGEVRFEAADLLSLPFADRTYDAVLCFRLLPHIEEWRQLIGELCRVAKRTVVVDYPSTRSVNVLAGRFFSAKKRVEGDTREFAVFEPARIADAFSRQGFAIVGEAGQFAWPMAMHRAAGSVALSRLLEGPPRALGLTSWLGSPRIARADRSGSQG